MAGSYEVRPAARRRAPAGLSAPRCRV